jgi:hypothetical protein
VPDEQEVIREAVEQMDGQWFGPREVPATKPAYHSVFVTRQGGIWVGLHVPSEQKSGQWYEPRTVFDVWEPTGTYLGRVQGPKEIFRRVVVDGHTLVTWMSDELGVQRVVRYQLVWN